MKSQIRLVFIIFTAFILLVDGACYLGIRRDFDLGAKAAPAFWIVPLVFVGGMLLSGRRVFTGDRPGFFNGFFIFTGFFLSVYIPKLLYLAFTLIEYVIKLLSYPIFRILAVTEDGASVLPGFMDYISVSALPLSLLAFVLILYGMAFGRFHFRLRSVNLRFPDLPPAFDGFRMVQISDLHLGSMYGHQDKIGKVVEMINREQPDLVVFTGDLVNNLAVEAEEWTGILSSIRSRYGSYSILGNHDYGEYYRWPDEETRMANMEQLYRAHRESGFNLLRNTSTGIEIKGQRIWIAGVENWGLPPFKQYGDLERATGEIPEGAFIVLLSHDPSHWDEEVRGKTGIQLTLSGHTHGMQFGIRAGRFRWSPIQLKYPRWLGLYRKGNQCLYVNPGLGHIGYAGRIGVYPEITLFTLTRDV